MHQLLTIPQIVDLVQISKWTIYKHIAAGRLRAVRVGRLIRVREEDLNKYLLGGETETTEEANHG